ncbi:MAG: EAL domain-containing protein [Sphingomonadaceae bacterium]
MEVLELWLASRAEALQRQYGFAVASRAGRDVIRLETRVADVAGVRSIMSKSALAFADGDHDTSPVSLAIVAVLGGERQTRIDLIETAEEALSQIEDGNEPVIVDLSVSNGLPDEAALGRDLQVAENRGELFLVYQPKVAVRKRCIASAEALIRWQHPVHGVIMPDAFIPLAERNGSIRELTLWVLLKIIADQPSLTADGRPFRTFMNVSGHLLTDSHFIEAACRIVAETRAEIGFEITETSVIRDPELAIANLERCAEAGVALAIDDYGAGLSSLAYLKRLPAQELKIDKMFVTQLTSSHRDPLIVRSTIDLAHALGMEVTAEGVESPAALALLTVMGCEMVQGYLISPPLKLEEFQRYQTEFTFEALQSDGPRAVQRPASFWSRKSTA